jgi:flagellar basal-body rod protein FlgC
MSLLTAVEVGASGLAAQRKRLEVLVTNLVNASTTGPEGPYRRKDVVFTAAAPQATFGGELDDAMGSVRGVEVSAIVTDASEPRRRYDPGHPHADKDGYVSYPNINPMDEMVNMLNATRSYEANLQAVNTAKEMLVKTLDIIR